MQEDVKVRGNFDIKKGKIIKVSVVKYQVLISSYAIARKKIGHDKWQDKEAVCQVCLRMPNTLIFRFSGLFNKSMRLPKGLPCRRPTETVARHAKDPTR